MKLVLMRHGPPQFNLDQKLKAHELATAVLDYKNSPLRSDTVVPEGSRDIASQCQFVLCSDLLRARQSLQHMGLQPHLRDNLFNESELPHLCFPSPALPIKVWAVLFRLLSLFGFERHGESAAKLKIRIGSVVDVLERHAAEQKSVLLMGHGLVNHFAGKELCRRGWLRSHHNGHGHWGFAVYEKMRDHD